LINLTKKDFKGGVLISISNFYDPLLLLIFTPLFIKYLTIEVYGLWVLIFSIANFAKLGSAGINSAVIKFLSDSNQKIYKEKFLINIFIIFFSYSLFLVFLLFLIKIFFNFENYFFFSFLKDIEFFFILSVFFILLKSFEEILINVYISYEDYTTSTIIKLFFKTILFIFQVLCLIYYKDITILILISCIILILSSLAELFLLKKKYDFHFSKNVKKFYNFVLIKKIFYYSKGLIINNIISVINLNLDKLIISSFLGLKTLGLYNIAFLIYSFIHSFFNSFFFFIFPKMSRIKKKEELYKIFLSSVKNILIIGFFILIFIFFVAETFFQFWLGKKYDSIIIQYHQLFLIINFLTLHTIPIYYYFISFKDTTSQAKIAFINLIFSAPLMIILAYYYSITGIIISKISGSIISIYQLYLIYKFNKYNVKF